MSTPEKLSEIFSWISASAGDILLIQRGNIGDDRRNGVNAGNGGGNGDRRGRNLNIPKN